MSRVIDRVSTTHEDSRLIDYVPNGSPELVFDYPGRIFCVDGDVFSLEKINEWLSQIAALAKADRSRTFPTVVLAFSEARLRSLSSSQIDRLMTSGAAVLSKPGGDDRMEAFMEMLANDLNAVSTERLKKLKTRKMIAAEFGLSEAEFEAKLHAIEDISESLEDNPEDLTPDEYVSFVRNSG